jgi:hypothetical protein
MQAEQQAGEAKQADAKPADDVVDADFKEVKRDGS